MSSVVGTGCLRITAIPCGTAVGVGGEQEADAGRAILKRPHILSRPTAIEIFVNVFSCYAIVRASRLGLFCHRHV